MTPEEFRRVGHEAVDLIAGYLADLPSRPVFAPVPAPRRATFAAEDIPGPGTAASPGVTTPPCTSSGRSSGGSGTWSAFPRRPLG